MKVTAGTRPAPGSFSWSLHSQNFLPPGRGGGVGRRAEQWGSPGIPSRDQVGPEHSATPAVQLVLTGANWARPLDLGEPSCSQFFY